MLQYDYKKYEIERAGVKDTLTGHDMFVKTQERVARMFSSFFNAYSAQREDIPKQSTWTLENCMPPKGMAQQYEKEFYEEWLTVDEYGTDHYMTKCRRLAMMMAKELYREDIEKELRRRKRNANENRSQKLQRV